MESTSGGSEPDQTRSARDPVRLRAIAAARRGLLPCRCVTLLFVALSFGAPFRPCLGQAETSTPVRDEVVSMVAITGARDELFQGNDKTPYGQKKRHTGLLPRKPSEREYNKDGSRKYVLLANGGFTTPVGKTTDSFASGFRFGGGAGRNFNRRAALLSQFEWDGLSVRNTVLGQLLPIYQTACGNSCTGGPIAEVFGSNHIWSFTLNPIVNLRANARRGFYATGGPGFYHKVSTFTAPAASSSCNGCAQYPTFGRLDEYTSNAAGLNGGGGITQTIADTEARFFVEVRFVHVFNQQRPYSIAAYGQNFNAFPANSQPTSYLPVSFGVRW